MDDNKFEDLYDDLDERETEMLSKYITPISDVNELNIRKKFEKGAARFKKRISYKKYAIIGISATFLLFTTLVYAGVINFSKIYTLIFGENSEYVEKHMTSLEPSNPQADNEAVSKSDNYIFKLVSAINTEEGLRIFATMTDVSGNNDSVLGSGNIIFDYWGLSTGSGGNMSVIDYDAETKTATIMISSIGDNEVGPATLTVNGFSANSGMLENVPEEGIDIYKLVKNNEPVLISQDSVFVNGGAYQDEEGKSLAKSTKLLNFGEKEIQFKNVNWTNITNYGFVDGNLHIQTKYQSDVDFNSLASINLIDKKTKKEHKGHLTVYFTNIENKSITPNKVYTIYKEMIYDDIKSIDQLKDVSISIDYIEKEKGVDEQWNVSLYVPEKSSVDYNVNQEIIINNKKCNIKSLSVSPLGIALDLPEDIANNYKNTDKAKVKYKDGTEVILAKTYLFGIDGQWTLNFGGNAIDIEQVESISINDGLQLKINK